MSLTIHRLVPTGGALAEAVALLSSTESPDPENVEFSRWYAAPRLGRPNGLIDHIAVPAREIKALLDEDIPETPAGRVWIAEIRAALARTESDDYRPFDLVDVTGGPLTAAFDDLTESLASTSPMTECLAAAVNSLISPRHPSVAAFRQAGDRLTTEGLVLNRNAADLDHSDAVCPDDFVRWEHAEALVPGFRDQVEGLIGDLLAEIPVPAADDASVRTGLSPAERQERAARASAMARPAARAGKDDE